MDMRKLSNIKRRNRITPVSSLMRGGDSEWLINYLRFIIKARCDQNMSIF